MKCTSCGRTAVYFNRLSGVAYCSAHFVEYFERRVRRTIRKYHMLEKGDHVLVAVSGGKDSMSLLHFMFKLKKKIPGMEITALLIDEGIKGYRERTIPNLVNYAQKKPVKYVIASFKDYIGETLDEMVKASFERNLPYMPCSYCGVFRRYIMNAVAKEVNATVIATAHNMDDVVQTFLMNLVSNNWDRILTLTPVRRSGTDIPIRRIKPFYEVQDKETAIYAIVNGLITPEYVQCPYIRYNIRFTVRKMINELEDKYPGAKYGMLRSVLEVVKVVGAKARREYTTCIVCGSAASHAVCRACLFRAQLGLLSQEDLSKVIDASKNDQAVARELRKSGIIVT